MTRCHICKQDHDFRLCPNRYKVFRADNGIWVTAGLFLETSHVSQHDKIIYTATPFDYPKYPSIQRLYLSYDDLTEYPFASECLGGWDHWQSILASENSKLQKYIAIWRAELEIKLKSQALRRIKEEAEADGRNGFAANKYIVEKAWAGEFSKGKEPTRGAGRPSKQAIKDAAARIAIDEKITDSDFDRLIGNGINEEGRASS